MKIIVLVDLNCDLIHSVYKSAEIKIDTLIVSNDTQVERIKKDYDIENILSMQSVNNFYKNQEINLDYTMLKKFINTQLKVEHFLSRVTTDINAIQYIYYHALSYWMDRFKTKKIDSVISLGLEFGSTFDSVIFDVANYYQKKVFIIEYGLFTGKIFANQLFDYNLKEYLPINAISNGLETVKIEDFLYNSKDENPIKKIKSIKDFLKKTPSKYGGYLLVMFVAFVFGKFKDIHHTFSISWWTYFKNYIKIKQTLRHYNKLSISCDSSAKYIFYALHMEPESGTLVRTGFSNQLVIIKSIAQNLPFGWTLYVKEHPHQFSNLNNFYRYYYLSSMDKFKSNSYYDEIVRLKNVKLLDININSKKVIKNALAIATINGTITLESIIDKKPILLFSQGSSPFQKLKDIYYIENSNNIGEALAKIDTGFNPEYNDFNSLIESYFYKVSMDEEVDYKKLIENLLK